MCSGADAAHPGDARQPAGACAVADAQPLAFWFGHWDVFADGKLDGHNFVESALDGCAVLEHWDDASGFKGMSLFYFEPHTRQWKQVWVTDHALAPGGLKEKTLIFSGAGITRFQGTVWATPERMILDRTTLRRLDDGSVNQLIEYSKDGGTTWTKAYDALYRRTAAETQHGN
ncbi:MAG TPA: hypothetical protein VLB69_02880 [Rudaea sp.]|nr:hypothetical protein [Rudaea sp.]